MSTKTCSVDGCGKACHLGKDQCLDHYKEKEDYSYGLDAEIKQKLAAKFDSNKAAQAQAWLEEVSGVASNGAGFQDYLRNGQVLCKAVNAIKANSVKTINTMKAPFKERENIANYLAACKALGAKDTDLFMTQNLYEDNANLAPVVDNIFILSALAVKHGFKGPTIGVKLSTENKREFSQEVLAAGQSVMSLQTVGSYGFMDESKNPTLSRQIIQDHSGHHASSGPTKITQGSYGYQVEKSSGVDKIIKNVGELDANRGAAQTSASASSASASSTTTTSNFCASCGAKREAGKFCAGCGTAYDS
jgi:hypothetical protein